MINFTVGPVQIDEEIRKIGAEQVPYFRTAEFSQVMLENESLIKKFSGAEKDASVVFMTGSGTASMEATVSNILTEKDNVLVINGGSFGARFVELCDMYSIPYNEIALETGEPLTQEELDRYDGKKYTALIVNIHETSTGVYYDIQMLSEFCKKNNLLFIVDSISSFLADEFNMEALGVDIMITGSQKALACPPGVSLIVLSGRAKKRAFENNPKCMYLNLKRALENAVRGQTPFTPAVGILLQINKRLKEIDKNGGVESEIHRVKELAEYFRNKISSLPFAFASKRMSNAVTSLHPLNASAYDIFLTLKDEYGIWICPNGGDLKDRIFRVGHIGDLKKSDYDVLIAAFEDMKKRNLI